MLKAIKKWFIEREATKMLGKITSFASGWRTYAVQIMAILIALSSMIWGPYEVGNLHVPQFQFSDLLAIFQIGGGLSFLRLAVKKNEDKIDDVKTEVK